MRKELRVTTNGPASGGEVPGLWASGEYWVVLKRAVYDALIEAMSVPRLMLLELERYRGVVTHG